MRSYEKEANEVLLSMPYCNVFLPQLFCFCCAFAVPLLINGSQTKNLRVVVKIFSRLFLALLTP